MSRTRRSAGCVLLLAVLGGTACGGGGSSSPPSVEALASKLGCSDLEIVIDESQRQFGAIEDGSCRFDGERVQLLTYDTDAAQDRAIRIGREFRLISVVGDRWTVRVSSSATAEKVKAKLGGFVG